MQVTPSTYPSRGGLSLCNLSKAKMPQGVARFNELDYMIYYFRKDMSGRWDALPLSPKHPCRFVHACCTFVLLLLSIIDTANQARIESGKHVAVALFRRSTLHFFAFQLKVADTVSSTYPTQRIPFSSSRGEEQHRCPSAMSRSVQVAEVWGYKFPARELSKDNLMVARDFKRDANGKIGRSSEETEVKRLT